MDKINVVYDAVGHTLTVWLDDPDKESVCEETSDAVVLMKDSANRVIGVEILHYEAPGVAKDLEVETLVLDAS